MACDSLYCAWLKVHHPYELYVTMLKLYDEKKNTDKISAIISEMKRYKNISLLPGRWGQDNRDWLVDKGHETISQSISSIRYMSKQAAEDLYELSSKPEAEIGVELIPAKLNKEGKLAEKELKAEIAKVEALELTEEEANIYNDKFTAEKDAIWSNPEYLEQKAEAIHHTAQLDCFTNVLRAIQMNTCLDTRQIKILIELGYFADFGGSGKLMKIYNEYFEGQNKVTKTIKSFLQRLEKIRIYENSLEDEELSIREKLQSEAENIGLCLSVDESVNPWVYFVQNVDEKWGTTVKLYSISNGKSGPVKFRKADLAKKPVCANQLIQIIDGNRSPRYTYKNGKRTKIPGEEEYWVKKYNILKAI